MNKPGWITPAILSAGLSVNVQSVEAQPLSEQIASAISGGNVNLSMRLRHETVEQNNSLSDAAASTLRTRLTLNSAPVLGLSAVLEVDNVSTVGSDHYDSFIADEYRGNHSVIADPVGTEVNQAYLNYGPGDRFSARLGTQRILHGGQRFVGGVGWRQNEQTFDALTGSYRGDALELDYSYVWNVNRIFNSSKTSVQLTDFDSDSHFLLGTRKFGWGSLSGYYYALDFTNASALSSATLGLSYTTAIGPVTLNAALARQSDHGDNTVDYDADYLSADLSLPVGPARLSVGYELLGSDRGIRAFTTPLATLHKWQGWTDLFLGTPAAGIEDRFIGLSGNVGLLSLSATWHDFRSDFGAIEFGSEWDLIANYPINDMFSAQVKYATYDSDGYAVDTDKLWLMLNVIF